MKSFYAICPFCKKSIFVEENLSGGYACPICGQALGLSYLQTHNLIINTEAANEEYRLAHQYFENTDFFAAGEHYKKVLTYNPNHYLANYYAHLCDIYEHEDKTDFNVPKAIIEALKSSIDKLSLSQVKLNDKIEFLNSVLNQTHIILSSHFDRIYEAYEKTEMWDILRDKCLNIASTVKELTDIDKEQLMVFDGSIAKALISIADLAICACQKIVQPHLMSASQLDLPTDYEYEKAKGLYSNFLYYATALDPKYNFSSYKPDYTGNLLYNESVISKLNRYNYENKAAQKKLLSTPSAELDSFRSDAAIAIKYSYHTCFKGLYTPKNDQARIALINESISFCFETLMPRVYIGEEKRVDIDIKNYARATDVAFYLNRFLNDFAEYNRRLAAEYVNRFYKQLHELTKLYFSIVYSSYNKYVNKIKESRGKEYRYYKNFLYQIICCCALALKDIVSFDQHTLNERIKILKLGKQATEEFLLLNDYHIEELEQSAKYSDVLDVFNAFDDSLTELTSKK
ncbi:MAG: hypothetical protein K2M95_06865 [Clostridiales bacterium]|nr:hypothetical protein [Clostridiales bacterium]